MARAAVHRGLTWQVATVLQIRTETPRTRTITLQVDGWTGHRAGQHVDVRLTAADGYQVERSYSIASAPSDADLELTVERLPDGEVSPYLTDELRPGDDLELRGPIGGYFVWPDVVAPQVRTDVGTAKAPMYILLVAGGSGIVPLRAMLRHHRAMRSTVPVRLLYSARDYDDVVYRVELMEFATSDEIDVSLTLTRSQPSGWHGFARRVDRAMLGEVAWPPADARLSFVCGPTAFVESVADALVSSGHDPSRIRTERFGGTP